MTTTQKHPAPRVLGADGPIPVDFAVRMYTDHRRSGAILIRGGPGSDLTAAANHLKAEFRGRADVRVSDEQLSNPDLQFHLRGWAIDVGCPLARRIYTAVFDLAAWSTDEIIEYVLANYPQKAKSILDRIMPTPDPSLDGIPLVWRTVIDVLATPDSIKTPSDALDEFLRVRIGDRPGLEDEARFHLQTDEPDETWPRWTEQHLAGLRQSDVELLRCPPVLDRLALKSVIRVFNDADRAAETQLTLPAHLAAAAGKYAATTPAWRLKLLASLQYRMSASAAAAASILTYSGVWWPPPSLAQDFKDAHLAGVAWPGRDLRTHFFEGADLSGANLEQAMLHNLSFRNALLMQARLRGAHLKDAKLDFACLDDAILAEAIAPGSRFSNASLMRAVLDHGEFDKANFNFANLTDASLVGAALHAASLRRTILTDANCTSTGFCRASIWEVDFRTAHLDRASFRGATCQSSNFEGIRADELNAFAAQFSRCDFTASELKSPDFRGARFEDCGLAEISWVGADLREATFRNCTFHAGSSRSGLVGSPLASEGTRTGFYTDDATEQGFKSPDEIRKADLRGADLRGADLGGIDLYLVDLRGATLDPAAYNWARRCGAILHARR